MAQPTQNDLEKGAHPTTRPGTDLVTVLLGCWLMSGLFLDGYAHTHFIDELESFFTPWHAVFYSGFLATAGWIAWNVFRRMGDGGTLARSIPTGYGLSVVGIVVFAVGGVGDGIWHTVLGIEAGIDALLSPTHLLLFLGILLVMTTPLRSASRRQTGDRLAGLDRASVALSVTLTTALLAFFFFYLWAPGHSWWPEQPFNGQTGEGELIVALGMASIILSNLILLGPLAFLMRRWRPPMGLATMAWGSVNALVALAFDLDPGLAIVVGLVGGLFADLVVLRLGAGPGSRIGTASVLTIAPLMAWSSYFLVIALAGDLQWPPEIWGGAILFTVLAGGGLATLSIAPKPDGRMS